MKIRLPFFLIYTTQTVGIVELFGFGLAWKDLRFERLYFSERNGIVKTLRIGHLSFSVSKRGAR